MINEDRICFSSSRLASRIEIKRESHTLTVASYKTFDRKDFKTIASIPNFDCLELQDLANSLEKIECMTLSDCGDFVTWREFAAFVLGLFNHPY